MSLLPFERMFLRGMNDVFRDFRHIERALFTPYIRDTQTLAVGQQLGELQNTSDKFAVSLDVTAFKPEELTVNVTENQLVIEGNHEEEHDGHGTVKRSFMRKYMLPEDANLDGIKTSLDAKGILTIEAPKKALEGGTTKTIPIEFKE